MKYLCENKFENDVNFALMMARVCEWIIEAEKSLKNWGSKNFLMRSSYSHPCKHLYYLCIASSLSRFSSSCLFFVMLLLLFHVKNPWTFSLSQWRKRERKKSNECESNWCKQRQERKTNFCLSSSLLFHWFMMILRICGVNN